VLLAIIVGGVRHDLRGGAPVKDLEEALGCSFMLLAFGACVLLISYGYALVR
jgi:hypothetical protein